MTNFTNLPWIVESHPKDYNGFDQLCLLEWLPTSLSNVEMRHTVVIVDNISVRGTMLTHKQKNRGGYITFIDMDELDNQTAMRIIGGYKGDMPVTIWCSIHNILIPERAIGKIAISAIHRSIGRLYYFCFDTIKVKRKTLPKRKPWNTNNLRYFHEKNKQTYFW